MLNCTLIDPALSKLPVSSVVLEPVLPFAIITKFMARLARKTQDHQLSI